MNRDERIKYLLGMFSDYPWFRVVRNEKPHVDLTREDCDLIAELLRNEKQYARDLREASQPKEGSAP